jgi:hypothetical protein
MSPQLRGLLLATTHKLAGSNLSPLVRCSMHGCTASN